MRITRQQLTKIIREEARRLSEGAHPDQQLIDQITSKLDGLSHLIAQLRDGDQRRQEVRRTLRSKLDSAIRSVQNAEFMVADYVKGTTPKGG